MEDIAATGRRVTAGGFCMSGGVSNLDNEKSTANEINVKTEPVDKANLPTPAIYGPAIQMGVSLLKDVVPGLTSLAAVLISLAALIYTNHQKNSAEVAAKEQRDKAADAAQKKALADLIKDFGSMIVPAPNSKEEGDLEIAAMKLAAYGDQALPGVKMALGARDDGLRHGGVLVAEQIYRAETVDHRRLIEGVLGYYSSRSPAMQRGVLEWLVKMKRELSDEEGALAVGMLRETFGAKGEKCPTQDRGVAMEVTNFLPIWPSNESKELLGGMVAKCKDNEIRVHASDQLAGMR
jgi:hypothetical protein